VEEDSVLLIGNAIKVRICNKPWNGYDVLVLLKGKRNGGTLFQLWAYSADLKDDSTLLLEGM
jgi:hypothetical protein